MLKFRDHMLVWVLFLVLCQPAKGAMPYEPLFSDPIRERWRWEPWPVLNGLGVQCVVEGPDRSLWFGTASGIRRYDGMSWQVFGAEELHGTPINTMCVDANGDIYSGSHRGISRFRNGKWARIFPKELGVDWPIWNLRLGSDGSIWAATARGALRILSDDTQIFYTTQDCATGLQVIAPWMHYVIVPQSVVRPKPWGKGIGVRVAVGLRKVGGTDTTVVVRALAENGPASRAGVKVGDRIVAIDGNRDVSSPKFDGPEDTPIVLRLRRPDGEISISVPREQITGAFRDFWLFDVFEDREGDTWFALSTGDVVQCHISKSDPRSVSQWRLYTEKDGLDSNGTWMPQTKFFQAKGGLLGIYSAHESHGISRFNPQRETWSSIRLSDWGGSNKNLSMMQSADGAIWVSGAGVLHVFYDGQWGVYYPPQVPIAPEPSVFFEASNGELWAVGLGQPVLRVKKDNQQWLTVNDLMFQCETQDGRQWFLGWSGEVISKQGQIWTRYQTDDGLIDSPDKLLALPDGKVWAIGSHNGVAAMATTDTEHWERRVLPDLGERIRLGYAGSYSNTQWIVSDGLFRREGDRWDTVNFPYGRVQAFAETPDSSLWVSTGNGLYCFDGQIFKRINKPEVLARSTVSMLRVAPNGVLWVGTAFSGAFSFDSTLGSWHNDQAWRRHTINTGMPGSRVLDLLGCADGSTLISTSRGFGRFDGQSWLQVLRFLPQATEVRQTADGGFWFNAGVRAIRYLPDANPPETEMAVAFDEVAQPGNTALAWRGLDAWESEPLDGLRFSYRLNDGEWSPYTMDLHHVFLSLDSGAYTFEVRARDADFNVDPTPARLSFLVLPPVWQRPWFLSIVALLMVAAGVQTRRVFLQRRKLIEANAALEEARSDLERRVRLRTAELSDLNQNLQQEMYERKQAEQELVRYERLRALMDLSEGVSHNLNNMLTGILGPAELLQVTSNEPGHNRYIEMILRSAQRAADLVRRLHIAVDTDGTEELRSLDANEAIRDALAMTRPRWKDDAESRGVAIDVVTDLADDLPQVKGHEIEFQDVLRNLILNAIDAMAKGGGSLSIHSEADKNGVVVTITDSGVGMTDETQRRLFEPFFTTKKDVGSGLGLAVVHGILQRWGATIDVESMRGRGATFRLRLPKWENVETQALAEPGSGQLQNGISKRILVVDDEDVVINIVVGTLSEQHDIVTAFDGPSGLELFQSIEPEIVILDLSMPGMSGDQVATAIKEKNPDVVTILITGWHMDGDDERLDPFDFVINKPFENLNALRDVVANAIALHEERGQGRL